MDQENQAIDRTDLDDADLAALIKKISGGDSAAFADFYDRTSSLIFGIVLRILGERAAAEEVLLDIYTRIWNESAEYDPEKFMPLEWLITIARTRAVIRLDWSNEGKKRSLSEAGEFNPAATVAPAMQNLARSSLESLTAPQKEVLDWVFYTGLSCSEIAARSGKPPGAVKIHTRIGMSKLYDLFRPLYERKKEQETAKEGQDIES